MIKAKVKAKAMIKAIPPLPLRSLVAVTKSSQDLQDLSKICVRFVQDLCRSCPRFVQDFAKCIGLLLTGDWGTLSLNGPGLESWPGCGLVPASALGFS